MVGKYYVYEHREADTGRTFYVGKGCDRRSGNAFHRSAWWKRIAAKHGFTVHRIYEGVSEIEALRLEAHLIEAYGRENLCNLTDGGCGGISGYRHTQDYKHHMGHIRKNKDVYRFMHPEHGEFIGTRHDLRLKYNLTKTDRRNISDMVRFGRYGHVKGWTFEGNTYSPKPKGHGKKSDLDIYCLYDGEATFFFGTRHAFCDETGMKSSNFSAMKSGIQKYWHGWSLA